MAIPTSTGLPVVEPAKRVFLPNGDELAEDFAGAEFCGTEAVLAALGETENTFEEFRSNLRRNTRRIIAEATAEELKKGVNLDHIKRGAKDSRDRLLPKVKCRAVERDDGVREIVRGVGPEQYLFTIEQLWSLKFAMHPAMEMNFYKDEDGVERKSMAFEDELPQPRDPVTGRMMTWTEETLRDPDRYLPKGWDNQLEEPEKTKPVLLVVPCRDDEGDDEETE